VRAARRRFTYGYSSEKHRRERFVTGHEEVFEVAPGRPGDLIHRYTRAEAIADGVLVDVTATAREAGIRWPVVRTWTVWERCVSVPPGVVCQDEARRP
jgi:hypothetical protein